MKGLGVIDNISQHPTSINESDGEHISFLLSKINHLM